MNPHFELLNSGMSNDWISGVCVTRSLVLYVCFVDRCLSFCTFSFGHCVVCSSSIYGFWLLLWYLQTLLIKKRYINNQFFWDIYTDLKLRYLCKKPEVKCFHFALKMVIWSHVIVRCSCTKLINNISRPFILSCFRIFSEAHQRILLCNSFEYE